MKNPNKKWQISLKLACRENSWHFAPDGTTGFPTKWRLRDDCRNSILMSIPRSGISALVPQTSFGGTGDVAKCRLFFSGQLKTTLGTKKCHDGDDNENVKKEIRWIGKTTTLHVQHAFLSISLPSLHDYDGKMPNFTFYGGRKQATAKFSFSFYTWIWFLVIRLKKSSLAFDVVNELE